MSLGFIRKQKSQKTSRVSSAEMGKAESRETYQVIFNVTLLLKY